MKLKSSSIIVLRLKFGMYSQTPVNCNHESTGTDIKYYDNHKGYPQQSAMYCAKFHNVVCTVHVFQVTVYSWPNTMHLIYFDMLPWWPPPSAGNTTPQIKKHCYWKVSILSCTHHYTLGPPSTHLPCMLEYSLTVYVHA